MRTPDPANSLPETYRDLAGKSAIVTGSSKGIGRGIALELARQGVKVVINYRHDAEHAARATEEIEALGAEVLTVRADVGIEEEVDAMIDRTVQHFGHLDVLVNNAAVGGGRTKSIELPPDAWMETHRVNTFGTFLCSQRAARVMIGQGTGGVIINIGSIAPDMAYANISDYNASKGAVHALTRTMARELGPYRVRVNCVVPGSVPDGMNRDTFTPGLVAELSARALLGRLGAPPDIAKAVAFLTSDAASWITGQFLVVDGGTTLSS